MSVYTSKIRLDIQRSGPLIENSEFLDTKDPCPVFDGKKWHIFGSGGSSEAEIWKILHATSSSVDGPWKLEEPCTLEGLSGPHVAAPGVVYDEGAFHMFIQTEFLGLNGRIEYLNSKDGKTFTFVQTAIQPLQDTLTPEELTAIQEKIPEAGLYDSHPSIINGQKYLLYSGASEVGRPDIYLVKSTTNTWLGPWQRLRPSRSKDAILMHDEVIHHNQRESMDYEWGLEGAQLVQLPSGRIILIAVCFLPEGERGTRQRVFLAVARHILGPYQTLGHILKPNEGWESGENGHAAAIIHDNTFIIFYQARPQDGNWKYGTAKIDIAQLEEYLLNFL